MDSITILNTIWLNFLLLLKTWWWLLLPIVLFPIAQFFYLWWIRWEVWYKELDWVVLEVVPPAEVRKPFRAMEDIFHSLWPLYDSPNWRERWCEGELTGGPFWFSFEITSLGGDIHFYIRTEKSTRDLFESVIHAHYPQVEVKEVPDYTQNVPQDIPNEKFDLYGEDYRFWKEDSYPIRTYAFFEIRPEEIEEEKKLDPFSALMERMSHLKKDEQCWFQVVMAPIDNKDINWVDRGRALADETAKRPGPQKPKSMLSETYRFVVHGKTPYEEEEKEEPTIPPEMKLTPGEREILQGIENKISKHGFKTSMRYLYIYPKGKYHGPFSKITRAYFMHFGIQNLNAILYLAKTRTKIHFLFRKRRLYARKKDIFRKYVHRFPPSYPKMYVEGGGTFILNSEELASIIHFPTKATILPPGVPRIPAKKGGPPPGIPSEPSPEE